MLHNKKIQVVYIEPIRRTVDEKLNQQESPWLLFPWASTKATTPAANCMITKYITDLDPQGSALQRQNHT